MVGGFILVALLFCILLAWPGRQRWPWWLIAGLSTSVSAALALTLFLDPGGSVGSLQLAALGLAVAFIGTATVRDLRDPTR
jgi:peptidoglycan/LPS O-acetylase OafA/YrhL